MKKKVLIIGKSGRNDCIADAVARSRHKPDIFMLSDVGNPSLSRKAKVVTAKSDDPDEVAKFAAEVRPDFAIIGPEEPLANAVVDRLASMGIGCVGPTKALARLESSKSYTRRLVAENDIPGNPRHRIFESMDGLEQYLRSQDGFVIKPDGLTSGKGVQVFGEHLRTIDEALSYCRSLFAAKQPAVIVEEKLEGEEFSFQSFCDGFSVAHTFPVQDHKRAFDGDEGPNTGGMGSYSCEDHSLPFLRPEHIQQAGEINQKVCNALRKKEGVPFKGILYGGFMVTRDGLRLIEYNARFGDPEVMNVLPILETDFLDVCEAIIGERLHGLNVSFRKQATVCKYVVPRGYPSSPIRDVPIDMTKVPRESDQLRVYYGAIDEKPDGTLHLTGSRAIAFVGIGGTLSEAERIAEAAASSVVGPVMHRRDIGTAELVQRRVDHMKQVMSRDAVPFRMHRAA